MSQKICILEKTWQTSCCRMKFLLKGVDELVPMPSSLAVREFLMWLLLATMEKISRMWLDAGDFFLRKGNGHLSTWQASLVLIQVLWKTKNAGPFLAPS